MIQKRGTMEAVTGTASVVLAAGRGSRMTDFDGNKTLLPLKPEDSPYSGNHPILFQILSNLPNGPKTLVINYQKQAVIEATRSFDLTYCEQPELNGTGGGLLAARSFLENQNCNQIVITMGDVPFVKALTYLALVNRLEESNLVVLGFRPKYKKQYGVLETHGVQVAKIIEWKYWSRYPEKKQQDFKICNSGIYAARRSDLLNYLSVLAARPHKVQKEINGKLTEVEEYFITDLVEYMHKDGLSVQFIVSENEEEVMGIDDFSALTNAQKIFRSRQF
jgi:bifunctional UDP-N-acetylglucosamine pyrophosphorylase/glucosamine-1-phosphate N-acetyltransferase